jgi:hypothetical protein
MRGGLVRAMRRGVLLLRASSASARTRRFASLGRTNCGSMSAALRNASFAWRSVPERRGDAQLHFELEQLRRREPL